MMWASRLCNTLRRGSTFHASARAPMRVDGVDRVTVWMEGSTCRMIDQRVLPHRFEIIDLTTYQDTSEAIRNMVRTTTLRCAQIDRQANPLS